MNRFFLSALLAFITKLGLDKFLPLDNRFGDVDLPGGLSIPPDVIAAIVVFAVGMFADKLPEPFRSWLKSLAELFQKKPADGQLLGEVVALPTSAEDGKAAVKILADRIIAVCPSELVTFRGVAEKLGGAEYASVIPEATNEQK